MMMALRNVAFLLAVAPSFLLIPTNGGGSHSLGQDIGMRFWAIVSSFKVTELQKNDDVWPQRSDRSSNFRRPRSSVT